MSQHDDWGATEFPANDGGGSSDRLPDWILPDGTEAEFDVLEWAKTTSKAGNKMAELTLGITAGTKTAKIYDRLVLKDTCQWKIIQFFKSIGELSIDWSLVDGAAGRCILGIDKHQGNDGETKHKNVVKRYLEAESKRAVKSKRAEKPEPQQEDTGDDNLPF